MNGLKRILSHIGVTQVELAKLLGVSPRTVSLWATGEISLPGPVRAYLRMLQSADASVRTVELRRLTEQHGRISEGLYSISYKASGNPAGSAGSALALVGDGRLIGADAWGGKFEGTYRFDTERRTYHLHIWLRVPPENETVTGSFSAGAGTLVQVEADFDPPDPLASTVATLDGRPVDLSLAYLGPPPGPHQDERSKGTR
jgi:transcriptional regulator with XRE-family HTH domain